MQVAKWGDSLAVRLPAAVVEALALRDGDEIQVAGAHSFGVARKAGRDELIGRLRAFRGRLPADFVFAATRRMAGGFLDTDVLVHVASGDEPKAERAEAVIAAGGTISVQVLNALAHVVLRKMRLSWPELRGLVGTVRALLTFGR